jgi:predicted CopG family antitoxin
MLDPYNIYSYLKFIKKEISYVIRELEEKKKLRKFMRIMSVPSEDEVYSIMSSFDPKQFINFVIGLLNNVCSQRKRGLNHITANLKHWRRAV